MYKREKRGEERKGGQRRRGERKERKERGGKGRRGERTGRMRRDQNPEENYQIKPFSPGTLQSVACVQREQAGR